MSDMLAAPKDTGGVRERPLHALWMGAESQGPSQDGRKANAIAIGALKLVGNTALGILALALPFAIIPWLPRARFGALPYLNTSKRRVDIVMALIESAVGRGSLATVRGAGGVRARRFLDLGSGDGVVVVEAARRGMQAHGVELNPVLVGVSLLQAEITGVGYAAAAVGPLRPKKASARRPEGAGTARFWVGNLFSTPVDGYDVVMCFGVAPMMPALSQKLGRELQPGSLVVMNRFRLPEEDGWEVVEEADSLALYSVTQGVKERVLVQTEDGTRQ